MRGPSTTKSHPDITEDVCNKLNSDRERVVYYSISSEEELDEKSIETAFQYRVAIGHVIIIVHISELDHWIKERNNRSLKTPFGTYVFSEDEVKGIKQRVDTLSLPNIEITVAEEETYEKGFIGDQSSGKENKHPTTKADMFKDDNVEIKDMFVDEDDNSITFLTDWLKRRPTYEEKDHWNTFMAFIHKRYTYVPSCWGCLSTHKRILSAPLLLYASYISPSIVYVLIRWWNILSSVRTEDLFPMAHTLLETEINASARLIIYDRILPEKGFFNISLTKEQLETLYTEIIQRKYIQEQYYLLDRLIQSGCVCCPRSLWTKCIHGDYEDIDEQLVLFMATHLDFEQDLEPLSDIVHMVRAYSRTECRDSMANWIGVLMHVLSHIEWFHESERQTYVYTTLNSILDDPFVHQEIKKFKSTISLDEEGIKPYSLLEKDDSFWM